MKQIENNTLCYYCIGCNKQELEEYKPVLRCNCFMQATVNWREDLVKALKEKK